MLVFMHKYIEGSVQVEGNANWCYRVVSTLLGKGWKNHTLFNQQLIKELNAHK